VHPDAPPALDLCTDLCTRRGESRRDGGDAKHSAQTCATRHPRSTQPRGTPRGGRDVVVWLVTQRSRVQIPPPLPRPDALSRTEKRPLACGLHRFGARRPARFGRPARHARAVLAGQLPQTKQAHPFRGMPSVPSPLFSGSDCPAPGRRSNGAPPERGSAISYATLDSAATRQEFAAARETGGEQESWPGCHSAARNAPVAGFVISNYLFLGGVKNSSNEPINAGYPEMTVTIPAANTKPIWIELLAERARTFGRVFPSPLYPAFVPNGPHSFSREGR
jgi:hypothetical protein